MLRLPGFRCIAASSLSAACFFLREGTSTIYGQHGHHSFDSSLPSPSNHIGQGRKLWHQIQNSKPCISKTCHAQPQYSSSGIPANVLDGLPSQNFYQPEKSPNIPILPGERRQYLFWLRLKLYHSKDQINWPFLSSGCDNYYNGEVMPCLMRPWLPPFSYSTTEVRSAGQRTHVFMLFCCP